MMLTESCGCGAALTLDDVEASAPPWTLIREWRAQHAQCRSSGFFEVAGINAPFPPARTIDDVNDPRLDPVIHRRATIGYVLDHDPYGPVDSIPDSLRLDHVAIYLDRVNRARGVENRVPGDVRRIAREVAIAEGWPDDAVPLGGLRLLLGAASDAARVAQINSVDGGHFLNVYVAKGDTDPQSTWCNAVWDLTTGGVTHCEWSHWDLAEQRREAHPVTVSELADWIREGMPV